MKKDEFFAAMAGQGLALTYGDVLLKTGYSEVSPALVKINTRFSRNVGLKCPIVSPPMDRVTESLMAIAVAKVGGIGVIHRSLGPPEQAAEVARVKFHLNALVAKPITVSSEETIEQIENRRRDKNYPFQTFPVVDGAGRLVGLLTRNDFDFCSDSSAKAFDVMTQELVTARSGTDLETAYSLMKERKKDTC